jgi:hypothetical protein
LAMDDDECEVIHSYSRREAIADGVLVNVSHVAPELTQNAGFRIPVAMTNAVWAEYVDVPDGVIGQDWKGRLWDIVWLLSVAIRAEKKRGSNLDTLQFGVYVRNDNRRPRLVRLKAVCGPDDDGTPCITVMQLNED